MLITFERLEREFEPSAVGIDEGPVVLAAMTASELLVGVFRADTEERRAVRQSFVEPILSNFRVLAFDLDVARAHAQLWAQLAAAGDHVGDHDLIIGATALTHGYSLVTENVREFARIPGLTVIKPVW